MIFRSDQISYSVKGSILGSGRSLVDPDDVEMLQDMVIAAVNEALRNAEADKANNMSRMTGGLNLGGLF